MSYPGRGKVNARERSVADGTGEFFPSQLYVHHMGPLTSDSARVADHPFKREEEGFRRQNTVLVDMRRKRKT